MFSEACQKAVRFTRPVAVSTRRQDGKLTTDIGTMIVINKYGWAITAGHLFDTFVKHQEDMKKAKEIEEVNKNRLSRNGNAEEIKTDKEAITNHSFWWGWDGVHMSNVYVNRQIDLAVVKLEHFDPSWVQEYPVFADPSHIKIGRSLCRGGYPFISINTEFDENLKAFRIPKIPYDTAFIPNDGMLMRVSEGPKSADGNHQIRYVEMTTPGIKGQSGGPIFDTEGRLYGMQILSDPRNMGFHAIAELDGQKYVENQFVNIGIGLHISTIMSVLDSRNVKYDMEGDESGFRIVG